MHPENLHTAIIHHIYKICGEIMFFSHSPPTPHALFGQIRKIIVKIRLMAIQSWKNTHGVGSKDSHQRAQKFIHP